MSSTPRTDDQAIKIMFGMLDTVVPVEFARQLETELAETEKKVFAYKTALELSETELAEARAEIERLKEEHENSLDRAKNYTLKLSDTVTKQAGELFAKNKLIEQMREALKLALPEARSTHCENTIKAALAAERGEK